MVCGDMETKTVMARYSVCKEKIINTGLESERNVVVINNWRGAMRCGVRLIVKIVSHLLSDQLLLTEGVSGLVRDVVHWALVHLEIQKSQLGTI